MPAFSRATNQVLDNIVTDFGLEGALEVKKVSYQNSLSCNTFPCHLCAHAVRSLCWNAVGCGCCSKMGRAMLYVQVERTTNHDVKAIEYVLKERFRQHEELSKVLRVSLLSPAFQQSPAHDSLTVFFSRAFLYLFGTGQCYYLLADVFPWDLLPLACSMCW